jgi:hypothetical protein
MTTCSVGNCDRPSRARGLCEGHYKRLRVHGDPEAGRPIHRRGIPPAERYWHYVEKKAPDACWPWKAGTNYKGYGQFQLGRENMAAHRFAYVLHHGEIPEGHQVHHTCDNKGCQNPAHLEALTPGQHTLLGNGFSGRNARKTHCKRGHPLTAENCYEYPGRRMCKLCARLRARKQRA